MKTKLFGWVLAGLVALGATAQPASAYDHYARYDYSNYDYNADYDYNYGYDGGYPYYGTGDYRYANYGHVAPGARGWGYDYAAPTFVWKGRATIAVTRPIGFHLEPSVSAPIYGWLEPGTRLTVLGRGEGWAKVRSKWGTIGYVPEATHAY